MNQEKKHWIVVAAKDHIQRAVEGGFIQANHGKQAPMNKLCKGDRIVCYSSKQNFGRAIPYQKFTAIGEVTDETPYQGTTSDSNFRPYRRNVKYFTCQEAAVKPLISQLGFIKNPQKWGFPFMRGFFEISAEDFKTIISPMQPDER